MKTGNEFRQALHSGKTVYGTLLTSSSPRMFETMVNLRPDFVFLCNEHIFYNQEILGWMCRAYRTAGICPVVRILEPDPYLAAQALDSGAAAILAPYIEDTGQVMDLIGAVKYRPLKGRKLREILSGKEKPGDELSNYLKNHNRNNSLLLNIESPEGVRNLESFLSFNTGQDTGIDGIIIGPYDLSVSHGMPERYETPEFVELSCSIIRKARNSGVAAGGHTGYTGSLGLQVKWAEAGATIIMHSSDVFLFTDKYNEEMNLIRTVRGEEKESRQKGENI
jgi:2-keto-3-deoxy-L-rhamnonate aldolase RhmA